MPKRAHIVTMDEARATAQLNRQQSALKQRVLQAAPLKGAAKKAARTPGVRKLGQSPRAQEAPTPAAPPRGGADVRRFSQPFTPRSGMMPPRDSHPLGARGGRPSQPFAAEPAAIRRGRGQREVLRFDEREEMAAERAFALEGDLPDEPAATPRKTGMVRRLTERFGAKRTAAAKARASRSFDRQYGGASAPAAPGEGGPRAAVYQGQMGTKHKRAAQSLASGALGAATAVASAASGRKAKGAEKRTGFRMRIVVPAVVAACLVATCVFMYGPVQLWYQEMRENERLQVEYSALQERNAALQNDVDSLSSEAGIEDRVHQQYGWVREDERAVSVSGISTTKDVDFIANVSPGSITAPETWYSAFLDPLFGVE